MTGFGRGKYENEGRTYTVEIKSVNHKYSDINVRLPRFLNSVEDKIRKRVAEVISRGKIDIFVSFENYSSSGTTIRINKELAKEYIKELKSLAEEADLRFDLNVIDVSKFPEILKLEDDDDDSVEVFSDIVSITNELRSMEFDDTITDFNKFTARRSSNHNTSDLEDTAAQPIVAEVQQPVATPQAQPQTQVQQVEQPVLKPITTDELYKQINDDFDDGIEEL